MELMELVEPEALVMNYPPAYIEGIHLFNTGQFWHAHEQWEECWRTAADMDATFYKGIIQAAAALVKWQHGSLQGMQRNWAKSQAKLACLPDVYMGIDVQAFRMRMEQFVATQPHASGLSAPQIPFSNAI